MFAKLKSQDSNLELISMVRSVRRVLFLHFVDVFIHVCLVVVMFIVMIHVCLLVLLKVALVNLVVLGQMYLL